MSRLLAAAAAVLLALAVMAPSFAQADPPDCHGVSVHDPKGDNTDSTTGQKGSDNSDIEAGWITYDPATKKATANVQVVNADGTVDPPYVGISWEFDFNDGKSTRFVRAFQDRTGMVSYVYGTPQAIGSTTPSTEGDTTGKITTGKDGVISIDIPLDKMSIAAGATLKAMTIEVRQWARTPAATPTVPVPLVFPAPIYDDATGKGTVFLGPCSADAPGTTTPGTTTPGTTTPGTTPAQQPAALGVKVTVPRLSAKKLAKTHKFTVKLTGNATALTATLQKGNPSPTGKAVGSGKLAKLAGKGKLTVKVKGKLKKGTYTLTFSGRNAQGQPASGSIGVKIR